MREEVVVPFVAGAARAVSAVRGTLIASSILSLRAHGYYEACEALGLAAHVQRTIGEEVGDRAQKTFFGFLIRSARTAGVTPWIAFGYAHRARERMYQGGDVSVVKVGPKEARVTCVGLPFVRIPYFRHGFVGVQAAGLRLFTSKVYVRELVELGTETTLVTAISWV